MSGYIVFGADPIGVVCALFSEPVDGFDQTCIATLLGGGEELIRIW